MDVVMALDDPERQSGIWGYGRGGAAVTKGASITLAVKPVSVGSTKGKMQVVAEGNLTRLLYGADAKCLSLPLADVADGVREMLRIARVYLPTLAPSDPAAWKLSRVDANGTWDVPEGDAVDLLKMAGQSLWSWDGTGHAVTSQGGRNSWLHKASREEEVAVYCKSTESGVWLSPDSRLVRLESRVMGRKARSTYGDTMADLTDRGAVVGMGKVEAWTQKIGRSFVGESMALTFDSLVKSGMLPADAAKMLGPCVLLGQYGIKGCIEDLGLPPSSVYRWAKVLRDSGTRAEELAGGYGDLLKPADATFADSHFTRLAPADDVPATVHGAATSAPAANPRQPSLSPELVGATAPWDA